MDNKRLVLILLVIIVIFGCKVTCSNINEYYKNYSKQKIDDCKKCRCRHDNNDRCSEECPSDMNIGVFNCISSDGQNYKLEKKNYVDNKGFNQEDNQEDNQGSTIREDCTWSNNKCIPNDQYYQGNQNKYNKKQENNRCLILKIVYGIQVLVDVDYGNVEIMLIHLMNVMMIKIVCGQIINVILMSVNLLKIKRFVKMKIIVNGLEKNVETKLVMIG